MNKRIQELKQQATDYVDRVDDGLKLDHYQQQVDLKFAELIVRECIDILPEKVKIDGIYEANILVKCGTAIKEHFGVKE